MRKMIRQLIILLGVMSVTLPGAFAQEANLSGYWETDWGPAIFIPDGSGYSGTYTDDNGRFSLKYASDGKYEGFWAEDSSARECTSQKLNSYHWGRLAIAVPKTRGPMTMKWAYCDDGDLTRNWNINPSDKKPDVTTALIGNWKATWVGYEYPNGFITVTAPEADPNTSNASISSTFNISGWRKNFSPANLYSQSAEIAGNGEIKITWSYGHLGHWGGDSELRQESANKIVGKWSYGGDGSPEMWIRSRPHGAYTQAQHGFVDGRADLSRVAEGLLGPIQPIGKLAVLSTIYAPPEIDMRGNRDTIFLNLYGRDLWGQHALSIDSASGLEPHGYKYICQQGEQLGWASHSTQDVCFEQGGIIGLRIPMTVWAHAKPGLKFLELNDQKIPFKLDVKNVPDPVGDEALETEIYSTVLLDDQLGQRRNNGSPAGHYSYPYRPDGAPTKGAATRSLVITGKNLQLDGNSYFVSADERLTYAPLTLPDKMRQALQRAAHSVAKTTAKAGEEVLVVKVDLKPGVQPGVKAFSLNGETAGWGLVFQDQLGKIRFLRAGATPLDFEEKRFYTGETIRVGVSTISDTLPLTGTEILLESVSVGADKTKPPTRRTLGVFPVSKTEDIEPGHNIAVSEPIFLGVKGGPNLVKPKAGETLVQLDQGAKLVATLVDNLSLIALPPGAVADVLDKPLRTDLWQRALDRVAACRGVGGDPKAAGFESKMSGSIEKLIMTNWFTTRQTKITKGDHAALILIRDQLIYHVLEENQKLKPDIEASNPERMALRYYSDARANPNAKNNAFWKYRKGTFPNPGRLGPKGPEFTGETRQVPLAETLDFDAFVTWLKRPEAEARDLIIKAVAQALKTQYDETLLAVDRARKAGNCNLEELIVIAGQKSDRAVASILPDLVRLENGRWIPDVTARNYVKSIFLLGEEIRALDEYSNLDDAYKSMAIAAVAAPIAWAGSAFAAISGSALATNIAAGTGYLALAADAADIIYFGGKGVLDYVEGEDDYLTALGLSPVLGADTVNAAIKKRQNAALAAIGIIAPAIGGAATFKSLYQMKYVNKGRTALRGKEGLKSLDELTDAERVDVAAYYAYLKDSDASKFTGLFSGEKADLASLDDLIKQAGGVPADAKAMRALGEISDESVEGAQAGKASENLSANPFEEMKTAPPPRGQPMVENSRIPGVNSATVPPDIDSSFANMRRAAFDETAQITPSNNVLIKSKGNSEEILEVPQGNAGQGSFNTAFFDDGDGTVLRAPGGQKGRPTKEELIVDRGGRRLFDEAFLSTDEATSAVRLVRLEDEYIVQQSGKKLGAGRTDITPVMLQKDDVIQRMEFKRPFSDDLSDKGRPDAFRNSMTDAEALAYDKAHRALSDKGLVWFDNKYDNFAFENHPRPSFPGEKRLVILDTGGIAPIKGRDPAAARKIQQYVNGGGDEALRREYLEAAPQFKMPVKRDLIVENYGDEIDVRGLGLDSDDLYDIPFNPMSVESFPKARALSEMSNQEAKDFYLTYKNYKNNDDVLIPQNGGQ